MKIGRTMERVATKPAMTAITKAEISPTIVAISAVRLAAA